MGFLFDQISPTLKGLAERAEKEGNPVAAEAFRILAEPPAPIDPQVLEAFGAVTAAEVDEIAKGRVQ